MNTNIEIGLGLTKFHEFCESLYFQGLIKKDYKYQGIRGLKQKREEPSSPRKFIGGINPNYQEKNTLEDTRRQPYEGGAT